MHKSCRISVLITKIITIDDLRLTYLMCPDIYKIVKILIININI